MVSYPYPLIPTPPGDWKNSLYDLHAIRMASLHNIFIRSFNAIIYHAPNVSKKDVPTFMKFCRVVANLVHEHHGAEEAVIFPFLETKLGEGAMEPNVNQHQDFTPKFEEWNDLCGKILNKESEYDATKFVALLRESTDALVEHLADEIPTMESSILQKHFSEAELRELEARLGKKIQESISVWIMPILFVSGDLNYNSWLPDEIPRPVIWFARQIAMRFSSKMWKYGQSNKYCQLKNEFKPMYNIEV